MAMIRFAAIQITWNSFSLPLSHSRNIPGELKWSILLVCIEDHELKKKINEKIPLRSRNEFIQHTISVAAVCLLIFSSFSKENKALNFQTIDFELIYIKTNPF